MPFGVRGKALPDDMMPELLKLHGQGKSAEFMVVWLRDTHGIEVSAGAIRKRLAKVRAERAKVSQAIIADKVSRTVAKDLDEVGFAIERALQDELTARMDAESEAEVKTVVAGKEESRTVRKHEPGSESWSRVMHVVSRSRNDLGMLLKLRLQLAGANEGKKQADAQQVTEDLLARVDRLMTSAKANVKPAAQADGPTTLQ